MASFGGKSLQGLAKMRDSKDASIGRGSSRRRGDSIAKADEGPAAVAVAKKKEKVAGAASVTKSGGRGRSGGRGGAAASRRKLSAAGGGGGGALDDLPLPDAAPSTLPTMLGWRGSAKVTQKPRNNNMVHS